MARIISHFALGNSWDGSGEGSLPIYNPATGKQTGRVKLATREDVDDIVQIAKKAFPAWAATSAAKRARVMIKFHGLLEAHRDELAKMISLEHGKTFDDAKGEVQRGVEVVEYAISAPEFMKGDHSDTVGTGVDTKSIRYPLGVVAGITPFNFPAMVPMWMFPMAIACGNTFILKPSEKDPTVALRIAELLAEAGLPEGVFNVCNGDKDAVNALLQHPDIEAVSFVGSTPIAKYVHEEASKYGKRVQALGGAKNHMIVMPDADMDAAVKGLMGAAYGSAGERCMAISVAVAVGDDVADDLIGRLKASIATLKVGPGMEEGVEMGPLVSKAHKDKVVSYIDLGEEEGASLVVDGRPLANETENGGFFVGATLFDKVTQDMRIYKEEIFGPVLGIVRVKTYAEALELVNEHEFGNGVSIYTQSGRFGRDFYQRVKCGMVGVNIPIPVPVAYHSFGGWKASLFGDHHMHGPEGVRFYTRLKAVTMAWPAGGESRAEFSMPVL